MSQITAQTLQSFQHMKVETELLIKKNVLGRDVAETKRPICVLIAEDDKEMSAFLAGSLRRDNYDVFEIANDLELHSLLSGTLSEVAEDLYSSVDVIVSDVCVPGMTALDVIKGFKRLNRNVPVVLITAFGDQETVKEAMEYGANAVFDKPFDIKDFKTFMASIRRP